MANIVEQGVLAEIQLISKIIETGDTTIVTENGLTSDYFINHKKEFNFIANHVNKYKAVPDKATFISEFDSFDICETKESTKYIIDILAKVKTANDLTSKFAKMREFLINGEVDKALDLDKQLVEESSTDYLKDVPDILSREEANERYAEYVEKGTNVDNYFITTGFEEFDKAFGGGWDRREEFATIVARPGVGKSQCLDKMAAAASEKGYVCGLYSGEMSKNKVGYRIDTFRSHISNSAISHGYRDVDIEYKRYVESIDDGKHGPIYIATIKESFAGHTPTIRDFEAFINKYHLDIFFIDQQSLMDDLNHTKNPIEKAGNIAQEIKLLQSTCKIPIITVCQQNRSGEKDKETGEFEYDVSRIANNDKIGQYSTIVIFLEYNKDLKILKVVPAKVRDGGGKTEKYAWDIDTGIFTHVVDEEEYDGEDACEKVRQEFEGDGDEQINW